MISRFECESVASSGTVVFAMLHVSSAQLFPYDICNGVDDVVLDCLRRVPLVPITCFQGEISGCRQLSDDPLVQEHIDSQHASLYWNKEFTLRLEPINTSSH